MGDRYSALQWMAPQLARSGLVLNEGWVERQAMAACDLYADKDLHPLAMLLAVMHEHALEYLTQAPVLVLGVAAEAGLASGKRKRIDRQCLAYRFGPLIRRGTRLKSLMGEFGLPLPLRKIVAREVRQDRTGLFTDRLARMLEPSALSQAIPEDAATQRHWVGAIDAFDMRARHSHGMRAMGRAAYAERFAWAASAMARAIAAGEDVREAGNLIDFLVSPGHPFNARWSWLRAMELSQQWHDNRAVDDAVNAALSFSPAKEFDIAPFPERAELQGLEFVALRSVLALREEGRKMHNCVGGYHAELAGGHRFYSVRRAGQRLATVQLVQSSVVQVEGPANTPAKKEVKAALGKFLECVGKGEFPIEGEAPQVEPEL